MFNGVIKQKTKARKIQKPTQDQNQNQNQKQKQKQVKAKLQSKLKSLQKASKIICFYLSYKRLPKKKRIYFHTHLTSIVSKSSHCREEKVHIKDSRLGFEIIYIYHLELVFIVRSH